MWWMIYYQLPFVDQKTVISLASDGTAKAFAETFDDGSIDNCEILEFNVEEWTVPATMELMGLALTQGSIALDVGNANMIAPEVTDAYGNKIPAGRSYRSGKKRRSLLHF
ncbi:MAG: hypothetical protein IPI30_12430 [Saprospiraceae bacterium]|nr:hypothetical protein [Candidatus Vicinibacter affinis]